MNINRRKWTYYGWVRKRWPNCPIDRLPREKDLTPEDRAIWEATLSELEANIDIDKE